LRIKPGCESMVARLKLSDFAKEVTVSDDDVKKFFDDKKNKPALMVEARRKVKYVALALTDDEKKLPASEKRQARSDILTPAKSCQKRSAS
jgi:hypothetical protein